MDGKEDLLQFKLLVDRSIKLLEKLRKNERITAIDYFLTSIKNKFPLQSQEIIIRNNVVHEEYRMEEDEVASTITAAENEVKNNIQQTCDDVDVNIDNINLWSDKQKKLIAATAKKGETAASNSNNNCSTTNSAIAADLNQNFEKILCNEELICIDDDEKTIQPINKYHPDDNMANESDQNCNDTNMDLIDHNNRCLINLKHSLESTSLRNELYKILNEKSNINYPIQIECDERKFIWTNECCIRFDRIEDNFNRKAFKQTIEHAIHHREPCVKDFFNGLIASGALFSARPKIKEDKPRISSLTDAGTAGVNDSELQDTTSNTQQNKNGILCKIYSPLTANDNIIITALKEDEEEENICPINDDTIEKQQDPLDTSDSSMIANISSVNINDIISEDSETNLHTTASNSSSNSIVVPAPKDKEKIITLPVIDIVSKDNSKVIQRQQQQTYNCLLCPKTYRKRKSLMDHYKVHPGYCHDCGNPNGLSLEEIIQHNRDNHLKDFPFICEKCGESYSRRQQFTAHVEAHRKRDLKKISIGDGGNSANEIPRNKKGRQYQDESGGYKPESSAICEVCGAGFTSKNALANHVKCTHKKDDSFVCHICLNKFSLKANLEHHVQLHTDVKRTFVCEKCASSYFTYQALQDHFKNAHTDVSESKCTLCGKNFGSIKSLQRHLPSHSEERPHCCAYCTKTFKWKTHLTKHKQSEHAGAHAKKLKRPSKSDEDSVPSTSEAPPTPAPTPAKLPRKSNSKPKQQLIGICSPQTHQQQMTPPLSPNAIPQLSQQQQQQQIQQQQTQQSQPPSSTTHANTTSTPNESHPTSTVSSFQFGGEEMINPGGQCSQSSGSSDSSGNIVINMNSYSQGAESGYRFDPNSSYANSQRLPLRPAEQIQNTYQQQVEATVTGTSHHQSSPSVVTTAASHHHHSSPQQTNTQHQPQNQQVQQQPPPPHPPQQYPCASISNNDWQINFNNPSQSGINQGLDTKENKYYPVIDVNSGEFMGLPMNVKQETVLNTGLLNFQQNIWPASNQQINFNNGNVEQHNYNNIGSILGNLEMIGNNSSMDFNNFEMINEQPASGLQHNPYIQPQPHQSPIQHQPHQSPLQHQPHQSPLQHQPHQSPLHHQIHQPHHQHPQHQPSHQQHQPPHQQHHSDIDPNASNVNHLNYDYNNHQNHTITDISNPIIRDQEQNRNNYQYHSHPHPHVVHPHPQPHPQPHPHAHPHAGVHPHPLSHSHSHPHNLTHPHPLSHPHPHSLPPHQPHAHATTTGQYEHHATANNVYNQNESARPTLLHPPLQDYMQQHQQQQQQMPQRSSADVNIVYYPVKDEM